VVGDLEEHAEAFAGEVGVALVEDQPRRSVLRAVAGEMSSSAPISR
jgi:hypothetical protein